MHAFLEQWQKRILQLQILVDFLFFFVHSLFLPGDCVIQKDDAAIVGEQAVEIPVVDALEKQC